MPQQPLQTSRLSLVPLTDEHLDDEVLIDADPDVMTYVGGRPRTPAEVEESHRQRMHRGHQVDGLGFWAGLTRTQTGAPAFVGWWVLGPPHGPDQPDWRTSPGVAELGYRLRSAHWRQGLATEGARELLRHGFEELGLRRVIAQTLADNAGSRGVMRTLEMTYTRTWDGEDGREVEYEMTRHAWFSRHLT